ncbi:helix-turn-helix domain-containing protein [Leptospira bourretii]|uniref:Helix-turn-helix domain-containing protein n=1 Tax=Leptospira bourretii TaxID=2484962 RepID=A0A4R9IJS1_9LEPT|nr:7TM diverse intracellular signaling domain-containing protein [Leptospira bourretii]TGK88265.1 helix-turn-helix domain-containing protein [Leptospira bourretii]TGK88915.1 helix-turn-helix domain-containing protein [Leptospira bourretii]
MKYIWRVIFLLLLLVGTSCAPVGSGNQNVTNQFEFLRDTSTETPLNQIQKFKHWEPIYEHQLSFNFTNDVIWLRGKTSDEKFAKGTILSLEWKALDEAILFYPEKSEKFQLYKTGDTIPKSLWTLPEALYPSFQIPNQIKNEYFYIRIQSKSLISFPILSLDEKSFNKRMILETSVTWLILGVCAVMFVFALFYFFAFGLSEFFFYAGYVVCTVLWYNGQYGNAYDVLWPEFPWWQNKAILTFSTLGIPFSFQFVRMFLNTKLHNKRIDKILLIMGILAFFCVPAILISDTTKIFSRIATYIYLISIPLILGTALQIYFKGEKRILFFLISWGSYFIISYNTMFYLLGILPYSIPLLYSAVFIFPIDLFFLLFNLLQKYETLEGERNEIFHRIVTLNNVPTTRYVKSKLNAVNTEESLSKLDSWMRQSKPYLDEKLDLEIASRAIGLTVQQTSELLNSKLGISFRSYLNSFRITDAKKILIEKPEMSILSIAYATGFGSKTAFNVEFKKATGVSPLQFKQSSVSKNP